MTSLLDIVMEVRQVGVRDKGVSAGPKASDVNSWRARTAGGISLLILDLSCHRPPFKQ